MLDALIEEQRRLGLSDRAFAESLGIPRQTWNAAKMGKRPLSIQVIRSAVKRYPHLDKAAHLFLTSGDTKVADLSSSVRIKSPSNIDAEASERTRTLVLTGDHATIACRQTETAPAGQGKGGSSRVQGVPQTARKSYVTTAARASEGARQAVMGEAG